MSAAAPLEARPATLEDALGQPGFWKRLEKRLRRPVTRALRRRAADTVIETAPWGRFAPGVLGSALIAIARHAPVLRSTIRAIVTLGLDRLTGGPVDATYVGLRLRFYPARSDSARLMLLAPKRYQAEEFAFLDTHGAGAGVFLDIGANAGAYSFWAASRGRSVLAFEPDPFMADSLVWSLTTAEVGAVDLRRVALSDRMAEAAFSQRLQSLVAGVDDVVTVSTTTLLDGLQEAGIARVAALKIDVEGAEDRVLMPFLRDADPALYPTAILIEHVASPLWREDVMQALEHAGYHAVFRNAHNTGLVLRAPAED